MSARIRSNMDRAATGWKEAAGQECTGMTRPSQSRAGERARWLASLSGALDEAQGILAALDEEAARSAEAHHLRSRIAAIVSEVELLRRGGFPSLKPVGEKPASKPRWPGWNR